MKLYGYKTTRPEQFGLVTAPKPNWRTRLVDAILLIFWLAIFAWGVWAQVAGILWLARS